MRRFISVLFFVLIGFFFLTTNSSGQTCNSKEECESLIDQYEQKLTDLRTQKNTLSSQIQYMDTQIYLTTLRIKDTENKIEETTDEIENLGEKIEQLNESLDYLGKILLNKIVEGYKRREVTFLNVLIDSENASTLTDRLKYIRVVQDNDRKVAFQVQQAKLNFEEQRTLREEKKKQLDQLKSTLASQQIDLNNQKSAKQRLLTETKSDEIKYQNLLNQARAEYAAIQGIVAGAGNEVKIREVKKGDLIASVIPSASCNSSGSHLHFIVKDGENVTNPFNYLKSVDFQNCSGSSCGSGDGDPFNPSGSWDWPLTPAIEMAQGYGSTWAVQNTWVGSIYSFHNGIDISSSSYDVRAVADGDLYVGSYGVGCSLPFVKVDHKDSDIETYYLHVNSR